MVGTITIAGAGLMGASFAQINARYGCRVEIYDISTESIEKGKALIRINQETLVERGELTQEQSDKILSLIYFTTEKNCFKHAEFVIEAIIEKMPAKHEFWQEVSELAPEDAVLTSNTSGLSITGIARAVKRPERFCGMHWVNPPHIVPPKRCRPCWQICTTTGITASRPARASTTMRAIRRTRQFATGIKCS